MLHICMFEVHRNRFTQNLYLSTLRVRSHCAICDCDLFLLTMGCIGVGDVVPVA